jgi:phage tail-like protein
MANENDIRHDPQTAFCFAVEVDGISKDGPQAFFKSVSGLRSETEVFPYKEGGFNTTTHHLIGPTRWPNLVLKKGFTGDESFIQWRKEIMDDASGKRGPKRRNGKIKQLNSKMEVVYTWSFEAGWPCKWEGPDFDASKSELSIETIEIAHEGLTFTRGSGGGGGGSTYV